MPSLLSQLTKAEQASLLENLNYMNLEEIRGFCSERGIPYRIVGTRRSSRSSCDCDLRHPACRSGDGKVLPKAKAKSALEMVARIAPVRAAERRLDLVDRGRIEPPTS